MTHIDQAIVKYWDFVAPIGFDVIRRDAQLILDSVPCRKPWKGTKPGCYRKKEGESALVQSAGVETAELKKVASKTKRNSAKKAKPEASKKALESTIEAKAPKQKSINKKPKNDQPMAKVTKAGAEASGLGSVDQRRKAIEESQESLNQHLQVLQIPIFKVNDKTGEKHDPEKIKKLAEAIGITGESTNPIYVTEREPFDHAKDRYDLVANGDILAATKLRGDKFGKIVIVPKALVAQLKQELSEGETFTTPPTDKEIESARKAHERNVKSGEFALDPSQRFGTEYGSSQRLPTKFISPDNSAKIQKPDQRTAQALKETERNVAPVFVTEAGSNRYKVFGGATRHSAAKEAGNDFVWGVIMTKPQAIQHRLEAQYR